MFLSSELSKARLGALGVQLAKVVGDVIHAGPAYHTQGHSQQLKV